MPCCFNYLPPNFIGISTFELKKNPMNSVLYARSDIHASIFFLKKKYSASAYQPPLFWDDIRASVGLCMG